MQESINEFGSLTDLSVEKLSINQLSKHKLLGTWLLHKFPANKHKVGQVSIFHRISIIIYQGSDGSLKSFPITHVPITSKRQSLPRSLGRKTHQPISTLEQHVRAIFLGKLWRKACFYHLVGNASSVLSCLLEASQPGRKSSNRSELGRHTHSHAWWNLCSLQGKTVKENLWSSWFDLNCGEHPRHVAAAAAVAAPSEGQFHQPGYAPLQRCLESQQKLILGTRWQVERPGTRREEKFAHSNLFWIVEPITEWHWLITVKYKN